MQGESRMHKKELGEMQLEKEMKFIHIPGPNPILTPGGEGDWVTVN